MSDTAELSIDCRCELGEGPFWHPLLKRLFWFDILNCELLSATGDGEIAERFRFDETASAAAVIDRDTLAVAVGTSLIRLDLKTDTRSLIAALEPHKPGNRTNDSRVNPAGGFWIGTMSKRGGEEPGAGAVYQYRAGRVDPVLDTITVSNSICFSPDGRTAYFADTVTKIIRKCTIDPATGLPVGPWSDFASTEGHRGSPDGSVVDAEGFLWNARWGGSCVVRHAPDGSIDRVVELPVSRVTCPAFGGDDLKTLYITSAREHMTPEELAREPHAGSIFSIRVDVPGQPDPLLKL